MIGEPFWIIGCGNMAGAMLARWMECGVDAASLTVVDPARPGLPEKVAPPLPAIPHPAPVAARVLLGIKPQGLAAAAPAISRLIGPDTVLLSILAGIEVATLRRLFPDAGGIVRLMPNLPVASGHGVVAAFSDCGRPAWLDDLLRPLGLIEWLDDEAALTLITALSGSGPAFLYRFIDALAQAATELGLPADTAARVALATVEGSAMSAAAASLPPAALAERVASKGGSTRAGLDVLDDNDALLRLVRETLAAATRRNLELAALVSAADRP